MKTIHAILKKCNSKKGPVTQKMKTDRKLHMREVTEYFNLLLQFVQDTFEHLLRRWWHCGNLSSSYPCKDKCQLNSSFSRSDREQKNQTTTFVTDLTCTWPFSSFAVDWLLLFLVKKETTINTLLSQQRLLIVPQGISGFYSGF